MGVVWTFLLSSILFSPLSPSLWETARYRLKYCLKGPLSPKQPTNQPTRVISCLLLRVLTYLAIIVTIFTFFFQTHMRECIFFSLAPILPTSAYVVFIFPRCRVLHTRICVSAFVPLRICVCFLISWGVPDLSRAGIPGVVSSHLPILL